MLAALLPGLAQPRADYRIGSKTFAEQYVLAALIEQRLDAAGLTARRLPGLGSNVLFDALAAGEIDIAVEYSGTLWANRLRRTDVPPRAQALSELSNFLAAQYGIRMLGSLGFENAYALAMSREKAEALHIRSISDIASRAGEFTVAGDYEIFARPEWAALRNAYGLNFRTQRQMQPEFMYRAAADGTVDVIAAYTSDGQIASNDLVVLTDDKHAIPPYDAILLVSRQHADDEALIGALKPLIGSIDIAMMREANARAADGKTTPDGVARWLATQIAKKR